MLAAHLPCAALAQDGTDLVTGFPRQPVPVASWPEGKKVAVSFALFVEVFGFGQGPVFRPDLASRNPDLVNEAFRQYAITLGNLRVGRLFKELDVPLTIVLNAGVCRASSFRFGKNSAPPIPMAPQHDGQRNIHSLNSRPTRGMPQSIAVLPECLVHEVRVAGHMSGRKTGPWPKPNSSTKSAKLTATFHRRATTATWTGSRAKPVTGSIPSCASGCEGR